MEFAVSVKDVDPSDKGRWVLAVDPVGERFLVVGRERALEWVPISKCLFVKAASPDQPRLVLPVESQPMLTIPNRAARRNHG